MMLKLAPLQPGGKAWRWMAPGLLTALLLVSQAFTAFSQEPQPVRRVSPEEITTAWMTGPHALIDVRTADEFAAHRLGLGERLIPLDSLPHRLHELPQDRSIPLIFVCRTVRRATEAAHLAQAAGWHNVAVLDGGVAGWPGLKYAGGLPVK